MSTPFLERFSTTVVARLVAADLLEVGAAGEAHVAHHVAACLGSVQHASLVSTITRALVTSPDVEELYADDDDVKAIIDDLDRRSAGF